ncbi:MAG: adenylate/guanylate cyclase domain-containing protein [Mycobacteriales bacterium]
MSREEWQRAGLVDPAAPGAGDRLALLEFLAAQGASVEEMVAADANGRLFALAGDRIVRPGEQRLTLRGLSALVEMELPAVLRTWRAFGLPDSDPDAVVASPADLDALTVYREVAALLGEDTALGMARVIGAAASRIADAGSAAIRTALPEVHVSRTQSELATAQAWATIARLVPGVGRAIDAVFRHHIEQVRRYFEEAAGGEAASSAAGGAGSPAPEELPLGVGFADMSGFTDLSRRLPLAKLATLMSGFESSAADVVREGGGRVVKFIGDAVMFVAPTPGRTGRIAAGLVDHPRAREAGLALRAGCAFGPLLAREGDYFGPPVNLAARLVALASPGTVLVDEGLARRLADSEWTALAQQPQVVRGLAEPITTFLVYPRATPA